MDCKKKEKHLNTKRNQLAIARQTRKISKLNVDICISQFCQKIKQGPYYVCTVCHRMLYRKSVLIFNKQKYINCNIGNCEEELPKKPVGRLSVNCRPTVGRQLVVSWPTVG